MTTGACFSPNFSPKTDHLIPSPRNVVKRRDIFLPIRQVASLSQRAQSNNVIKLDNGL